jgi:uncharacterized protein YdeI (YjbR/CyaY-like superfamily)
MKHFVPNPKVESVICDEPRWRAEFEKLREILSECPLEEELKWGCPCYVFEGGNIVLMQGFKEYCALLFTHGALLKDPEGILIQQTQNVQAARQLRFTGAGEVSNRAATIRAYVEEAVEIRKEGREVPMKKTSEFNMPEELKQKLSESARFKTAFEALTPGRRVPPLELLSLLSPFAAWRLCVRKFRSSRPQFSYIRSSSDPSRCGRLECGHKKDAGSWPASWR